MENPFASFSFAASIATGILECAIWDRRPLRVFVPFTQGSNTPAERQIEIGRQLPLPRDSIVESTTYVLLERLRALSKNVDASNLGVPDVWIPPAVGFASQHDDAFTLNFETLLNVPIQCVALIDGWKLRSVVIGPDTYSSQ